MLKLQKKEGGYYYSIWKNPVARVMKFNKISNYIDRYMDVLSEMEISCVLDYGSGDQPLEPFLKTKFGKYISADYAPSNVHHNKRPDIFIDENGSIKGIDSNIMDCVVITEVLEHVYEPKKVLLEISRVLKPGGVIIGSVPFAVGEHETPYDYHRYTYYCLHRLFEDTGLQVLEIEYIGDCVGVAISNFCKVFAVIQKLFNKSGSKGRKIGIFLRFILTLPEVFYYLAFKSGIDFGRVDYYRKNPYGFTFFCRKGR